MIQNLKKRFQKQKAKLAWQAVAIKIKPNMVFGAKTPRPPLYSDLKDWAAHPDNVSKVFLKPEGVGADDPSELAADVFYIHPTSFFGATAWNASLDGGQSKELVDELMIPSQASVFNSCCRVYAPRYRQATFYGFLKPDNNGRKALELAYADVAEAFQYYLQHWNKGRPFFIASHSQGTVHAMRLLEEQVDKAPCREQFIAAYTLGFQFPKQKFDNRQFTYIQASQSPTDTKCVVAWDTLLHSSSPMHSVDPVEIWHSDGPPHWRKRAHQVPISVNPLTMTDQLGKADANQNKGAVRLLFDKSPLRDWKNAGTDKASGFKAQGLSKPYPAMVSAEKRRDGFLYISKPLSKQFRMMVLPGDNYHNYDYSLFYMDIRQNVLDRLAAFLEKSS